MRISAKGRYALSAMIHMATDYCAGENMSLISISEKLGASKIYLEQIFSLLKRGGLIDSTKGSNGGYHLARIPRRISVADILSVVELSIFEKTKDTVSGKIPWIDEAIRLSVFDVLDNKIKEILGSITLDALAAEAEKHKTDAGIMFYI